MDGFIQIVEVRRKYRVLRPYIESGIGAYLNTPSLRICWTIADKTLIIAVIKTPIVAVFYIYYCAGMYCSNGADDEFTPFF